MSHPSSVSRVSSRSSFFSSSLFADLTRESCLLLIGGAIGSFMLAYSTMKAHWTQRDTVRGVRGVDLEEHLRALMSRHTAKKRKKATAKNQAKPPPHQSSDTSKSNNKDDEDDGIIIRAPRWDEAEMEAIALQMHESFNNFNRSVGLPDEFYSFDLSRWVIKDCMTNDVGLVAFSADGEAIGSCFNQEFDIEEGAVGCGPWSAKWGALQQGIGRKLIGEILQQSIRHGAKGIRLMQISANLTSFSLYTSLGFVSREPIVMWRGYLAPEFMEAALKLGDEMGLTTRTLVERDIATCDAIHREALGISRAKVLKKDLTSTYVKQIVVLNKKGKIIGYNTGMTVNGHTVVPDLPTLQFTIATAMSQHRAGEPDEPPFMHTCARLYPEIDRWLLQAGVKIERIDNNMCLGEWQPIKHEKYIYCSAVTY